MRHPAKDMGIAAQLIEVLDLGMMNTEIGEEVAHCAVVVTGGVGFKCSAEGFNGTLEVGGQRMAERPAADHEPFPFRGRTHLATARVYSR